MKIMQWGKDGGKESKVWGFWLLEIKWLFSIVLLRFDHGSREAYHSHAFNCISWIFKGGLYELHLDGKENWHRPGLKPVVTKRDTFHQVHSTGVTWVLSFRGPWSKTWKEFIPATNEMKTLTHGRKEV